MLGGAAAWPLAARAQQTSMPLVGVLSFDRREIANEVFTKPFLRYMKAIGWEEGRNIRFLFAWTEGHNERAPVLAGELVAQNANVIVSFGDPGIRAAQRATDTIPIVGMADDGWQRLGSKSRASWRQYYRSEYSRLRAGYQAA